MTTDTTTTLGFAETYTAARAGVVGRVVDCDVVRVTGPDARSFLQGQVTQDLAGLQPGDVVDSLVLSVQGRTEAYVRVVLLSDEEVLLVTAPGFGEVVHERLRRFRIRVKADLETLRWRRATLRGPRAAAFAAGFDGIVLPVDWPGAIGVDLVGPDAALPDGVPAGDAAAFAAIRVESGEPVMGREVTERTIAQEAGLVERTVSFTKGCYLGQELVARIDARGNNVPRRLRGVIVAIPEADSAAETGTPAAAPGATLTVDGREVGELTSVAWSPRLGATVALGYFRRDVVPPAQAVLAAGGDEGGEDGEPLAAEIVELPIFSEG